MGIERSQLNIENGPIVLGTGMRPNTAGNLHSLQYNQQSGATMLTKTAAENIGKPPVNMQRPKSINNF